MVLGTIMVSMLGHFIYQGDFAGLYLDSGGLLSIGSNTCYFVYI